MEIIICSKCGANMERFGEVNGKTVDWTNEVPICPACRGVPGAKPVERKRDILGGFGWKRDADGKKVPREGGAK
jgi:hypothetical protein